MILIGIDDTDIKGSPGTNQLAREIVGTVSRQWQGVWIVRHQLLDDPRVPCTTKNGSASIALRHRATMELSGSDGCEPTAAETTELLDACRSVMQRWFIAGSDPGLAMLTGVCPQSVTAWGRRCQRHFVSRTEAFHIAATAGVHLESLGGTQDGVIGALAALGLASQGNDGRVVQWREWPDDLSGEQSASVLARREVLIRDSASGEEINTGVVDVGKHLRPNLRHGTAVLFVENVDPDRPHVYRAMKLP